MFRTTLAICGRTVVKRVSVRMQFIMLNVCAYDISVHADTHWQVNPWFFLNQFISSVSGESALPSNLRLPSNLIGVAGQSKQSFVCLIENYNAFFLWEEKDFVFEAFATYILELKVHHFKK